MLRSCPFVGTDPVVPRCPQLYVSPIMKIIDIEPGTGAKPSDDSYIEDVAGEIEVSFPADYLAFISMHNGGIPIKKYFPLDSNTKVIERFLSFVADYKNDTLGLFDVEVVWSQVEDRLPVGIVPVAALFGGDLLCLDNRQEAEHIVIWDHEAPDDLLHVAESFTAFARLLHS